MASVTLPNSVTQELPEPAWEVATLFPAQGSWTEEEYLALPGNHLVEYSDGSIEVLAMPTTSHQSIVAYLHALLVAFVSPRGLGKALFSPLPVRLWPGKIREPDIVFMLKAHAGRIGEKFWDGADLVMEVVSEDRKRDLELKREEYARASIAEYWIIDPDLQQITVLKLDGDQYAVHGQFTSRQAATSQLLGGFNVDVAAVFAAAAAD